MKGKQNSMDLSEEEENASQSEPVNDRTWVLEWLKPSHVQKKKIKPTMEDGMD